MYDAAILGLVNRDGADGALEAREGMIDARSGRKTLGTLHGKLEALGKAKSWDPRGERHLRPCVCQSTFRRNTHFSLVLSVCCNDSKEMTITTIAIHMTLHPRTPVQNEMSIKDGEKRQKVRVEGFGL